MNRSLRTALSLLVALVVMGGMAVWGYQQLRQPLPELMPTEKTSCQQYRVEKRIKRSQLQVSVYNASDRSGLAGDTLEELEDIGIHPGETGNAPTGTKVRRVEVWARSAQDPSAQLLARMFRPRAVVKVYDEPLGPGTDLVVGRKFAGVKNKPPTSMKRAQPKRTCLD